MSFSSEPNRPDRPVTHTFSPNPRDSGVYQARLQKVLRDALIVERKGGLSADPAMGPLTALRRRYKNEAFALQPAAVGMVRAVLEPHFRSAAGSVEKWEALTLRIAEAVMEDPTAAARLERLWTQLDEQGP